LREEFPLFYLVFRYQGKGQMGPLASREGRRRGEAPIAFFFRQALTNQKEKKAGWMFKRRREEVVGALSGMMLP